MRKVAVVLKGYPRLSETFIAQELLALERAGINLIVYALRHPTDRDVHPVHSMIQAPVHYLPEYLVRHPIRVLRGVFSCLRSANLARLLRLFLNDLRRDFSVNRLRRLGQAMVLCREIASDRNFIYAHFLHTPASVARYCSILTGLPWSCSAHAKDIWTTPQWDIQEKLGSLQWLVTCTSANRDYLSTLSPDPARVQLLYHGLDLQRFPDPSKAHVNDGSTKQSEVGILSVGRAVPKKGYDVLLQALARLPDNLHWKFIHVGGGPLLDNLKRQATALNLQSRVEWKGPLAFDRVFAQYRDADIFVLASIIDANGDRDGLPNVLMEAMSQRLACISTDISGIPELLVHEHNGLIVESTNSIQLSRSIERLLVNPDRRNGLGREGRKRIEDIFHLEYNIQLLVNKLSQ